MAAEDLRAIIRYIGENSPVRAKSFGKEMRAKVGALAQYPELGRPGRLPGIRELVVHPIYIVFYHMLPEARIVEILRVKHAAQQAP